MRNTKSRLRGANAKPAWPFPAGLLTTCIICTVWLLWYLNHLIYLAAYSCRDYADVWLASRPGQPNLLTAFALVAVALLTWLYVDIIRPKRGRVPVTLRVFQLATVLSMLLINVMLSGYFSPYSLDGRVYRFVMDDVPSIPVLRSLIGLDFIYYEAFEEPIDGDDPHFEAYRRAVRHYQATFARRGIVHDYGMLNGQLECEAVQDIQAARVAGEQVRWADFQLKQAQIRNSIRELEGPTLATKPARDNT